MVTALYLLSLVMAIVFAILLDGPVVLMLCFAFCCWLGGVLWRKRNSR